MEVASLLSPCKLWPLKALVGTEKPQSSSICYYLEDQYAAMEIDKNDVVNILAITFGTFSGDEISMGPTSPIVKHAANITARHFHILLLLSWYLTEAFRTFLSELIKISDEALEEALVGSPENGCTYLEKLG